MEDKKYSKIYLVELSTPWVGTDNRYIEFDMNDYAFEEEAISYNESFGYDLDTYIMENGYAEDYLIENGIEIPDDFDREDILDLAIENDFEMEDYEEDYRLDCCECCCYNEITYEEAMRLIEEEGLENPF